MSIMLLSMRAFLLIALLLPATLAAQSTQPDIKARLVGQPLFLRGLWQQDKLHFDAAGQLEGKSGTVPFAVSGIDIDSVKLSSSKLVLEGTRVGLTFDKSGEVSRNPLTVSGTFSKSREQVYLQITAPAGGDFTSALDAIFANDLADLVPAMPEPWQRYAAQYFLHQVPPPDPSARPRTPPDARRVGGGVTPPRVLSAPEPRYNQYARNTRISGNVLVYLEVDTQGKPRKLRILRPIGMGLDEQALLAVAQYRFVPAMEGGKPVPVEMNVEVNFQIF